MRTKALVLASVLLLGAATAGRARAVDLRLGDEHTFMKLGLLLQGFAVFTHQGAPDAESLDSDFYLRRLRLLFSGQLNDRVNFFVETDNPNFGKQGDFSSRTFVQDAWVEFNLHQALQINAGLLLVPFSHHGMQGATSLHSLDYHSALIRYPGGSHVVWRDFGIMARGLLLDSLLEYRLAILNGVRGGAEDWRNPNDWPRLSARLTLNLFAAEGGAGLAGFFYRGIHLSRTEAGVVSNKKVLSFGASADWQKGLNVSLDEAGGVQDRRDYFALAADVFWDVPLGADGLLGLTGQVNFFYYDHGDRRDSFYATDAGFAAEYSGYGLMSELGMRYDALGLILSLDWFEATRADGDAGDLLSIYGGFNYWWFGHATNIKLQAGSTKKDGQDWGFIGQLQVQLLF